MPRRAANDFTIPGTAAGQRLRPPRDLDKPEAALFLSIVLAHPPERFTDADLPLLCSYTRACIDEQCASAEMRASGYVAADGKVSPWLAVLKEARRSMTTLVRALRLSPASRGPSQAEPEVSYYEKMHLLERRDEPN
jgi:phage terminase small subunit